MKQEGWQHSLWSFEARAQPQPVFLPSQRAPDKCRGPLNCDKTRAASNFKDFSSLGQHRAGATWQGGAGARVTDGDTDAQAGDRCAPWQGAGHQILAVAFLSLLGFHLSGIQLTST